MSDPVETFIIHGYTVEIHYDNDAVNPLKEFDGQPTLFLAPGVRYDLGSDTDGALTRALATALDRGFKPRVFDRWLRVFYDVAAMRPVSLYDHSGLSVSLGVHRGWDTSFTGFIAVTNAQLAEWGCEPDYGDQAITESFKEFADYVENQVYGYTVTAPDGGEIDACRGFYGWDSWNKDDGYMREQFTDAIEYHRATVHAARVELFKHLLTA